MSLIKSRLLDITDLQNLANEFRVMNKLSYSEPIRLKSILLKNNILTVFLPLKGGFSGMSMLLKENNETKRFILVNSEHSRGKQHFTVCHELYHLYFQDDFSYSKNNVGLFDKKNPEEYNADMFASFLLIPESGLQEMIPREERDKNKITLKTILGIEQYYACSRTALLYRLLNSKKIDKEFFTTYSTRARHSAIQFGYDTSLYIKGNEGVVIGDYGIKARELFDNGSISESSYFGLLEDMGVDLAKLESNGEESE
ncbi:MAG TPA: ImmA/IrrE family metallo-endopeptidase [Paludibacter sp.]